MASSLLSLFRTLASFNPPRGSLADAPWEDYVDWAIANGLGPLASYNLEYRLVGGDAPEWARDRLLSVYSGTVNDNVMKLVTFKRAVDDLQGRRLLMLGGATFAEGLYPHVAFRPVLEIKLRVAAMDLEPFAGFLKHAQFKPLELDAAERDGADRVLSDDHAPLFLYTELLGPRRRDEEKAMLSRALPVKVYGPSVFRPDLEDAILLVCLEQARAGYVTPMISFVDLRELALGSPSMPGPWARPVDWDAVKARAEAWRLDRALYASLSVLEKLFPETAEAVEQGRPKIPRATRALVDRIIVEPVATLGKVRSTRGADRIRKLMSGG